MGVLVRENFTLSNGMKVLVCEAFDSKYSTDRLKIGDTVLKENDFEISPQTNCFSETKTCDIVIRDRNVDVNGIDAIEFI